MSKKVWGTLGVIGALAGIAAAGTMCYLRHQNQLMADEDQDATENDGQNIDVETNSLKTNDDKNNTDIPASNEDNTSTDISDDSTQNSEDSE